MLSDFSGGRGVDQGIAEELRRATGAAGPATVRPQLARWATAAGVVANVVLLVTFFLNWTWQRQLGSVLPFGLLWLAGWWRWQGELGRHENAELVATIRREGETASNLAALRAGGPPADVAARSSAGPRPRRNSPDSRNGSAWASWSAGARSAPSGPDTSRSGGSVEA